MSQEKYRKIPNKITTTVLVMTLPKHFLGPAKAIGLLDHFCWWQIYGQFEGCKLCV